MWFTGLIHTKLGTAISLDEVAVDRDQEVGDRTGGHVDNLAWFVRPGVVIALTSRDEGDENHAVLQDNLAQLRSATDAQGRTLK